MKGNDGKFPFKMYSLSGNGALIPARFSEDEVEIVEITAGKVNIQIFSIYLTVWSLRSTRRKDMPRFAE